ncbi:MAG: phosphate ABC transporter ATP-binding protein [Nitrososphaerales archaeon]
MSFDKKAIIIKDLHLSIGNKEIIKGMSIEFPLKAITAIIGPSGSGKTLLLKSINRLVDLIPNLKSFGEIFVILDGEVKEVHSLDPSYLRRKVGYVFQNPNPFPHLSILENVIIGAKLNSLVKKKDLVKWAKEKLEEAGLWEEVKDRLKEPAWKLSGGQQQRLCIARMLALKPEIILLDEPTTGLDIYNTKRIEELMVQLKENYTVIAVTHSVDQAARIADYIAFLYDGRLIEFDVTSRILKSPSKELTEKFITGRVLDGVRR